MMSLRSASSCNRRVCVLAFALVWPALVAAGDSWEPSPVQKRAAGAVRDEALRAHIRFLADDLLEGRGPGSRGDRLAQLYISTRMEALGLQPGAPGGGWLQPFPLLGVKAEPPPALVVRGAGGQVDLRYREDVIVGMGAPRERASLKDAEVVFVGYGMVAPEYAWDDYKGADLRGKVLLFMNNDPSGDPRLFEGRTRLYYGRWTYKYEEAARQGAAGAFIIHTTPSAGYPWSVVQSSWGGEDFELRDEAGPKLEVRGWTTEEAAKRVARLGGKDLDGLRQSAESREFRPVPLGVRLSLELSARVREVETANVLGLLPGSDPQLRKELVVYTAHHDHLGILESAAAGADRILNGAVDNASGVAALLTLAEAFRELESPPRRSLLFAAVGAEEQGLLGSAYLAAHPPVPAGYLAATLNIDGVNIWGRTADVTMVGHGKSSLDALVESSAAWQGRRVLPDQFPDRGFYYRSDQFSLAKVGVPGVYLDSGVEFRERPVGWGKERIEEWEARHYHQPSDEYRTDWDLSGAVEDIQLLFHIGLRVAEAQELPAWKPGDEFEAPRRTALQGR